MEKISSLENLSIRVRNGERFSWQRWKIPVSWAKLCISSKREKVLERRETNDGDDYLLSGWARMTSHFPILRTDPREWNQDDDRRDKNPDANNVPRWWECAATVHLEFLLTLRNRDRSRESSHHLDSTFLKGRFIVGSIGGTTITYVVQKWWLKCFSEDWHRFYTAFLRVCLVDRDTSNDEDWTREYPRFLGFDFEERHVNCYLHTKRTTRSKKAE